MSTPGRSMRNLNANNRELQHSTHQHSLLFDRTEKKRISLLLKPVVLTLHRYHWEEPHRFQLPLFKKQEITTCNQLIMKQHNNDVKICIQMFTKNITYAVFLQSNGQTSSNFRKAAFLWRHLIVLSLYQITFQPAYSSPTRLATTSH